MASTQYLYIMLSRTQTGIGRLIRFVTRYGYNHVSLSLDPNFRRWVSFARYVKGVPLAGGFVEESPERFYASGDSVPVKIFRIEIPQERYDRLQTLFARAGRRDSGLIYNTPGALLSSCGFHYTVSGAYTCLEFANLVLDESHDSIRALDEGHREHLHFEGELQDLATVTEMREDRFFTSRGFWGGAKDTAWHFARLFRRILRHRRYDPISAALQ